VIFFGPLRSFGIKSSWVCACSATTEHLTFPACPRPPPQSPKIVNHWKRGRATPGKYIRSSQYGGNLACLPPRQQSPRGCPAQQWQLRYAERVAQLLLDCSFGTRRALSGSGLYVSQVDPMDCGRGSRVNVMLRLPVLLVVGNLQGFVLAADLGDHPVQ
jgi:hypothetical protein